MARSSTTSGKRSAAKTRKARSAKARNSNKTKRPVQPATRLKPSTAFDIELKEAREQQAATANILKVIASSPSDAQPVFEAIAASANQLIGGYSTTVYRFIDGIVHLKAFTPISPEADEVLKSTFPMPVANLPQQNVLRGETDQIPDTEAGEEFQVRLGRARGFRSIMFTPLMYQGGAIGMIAITRRAPGRFADHHAELLQTFADQAVIAIENARLVNEVQSRTRELEDSLQQQTATADVLRVISRSTFDLQSVLNTLVESATRLCEADHAWLFRRDGQTLHWVASFGYGTEAHERLREFFKAREVLVDRGSVTGRAALEAKVVHVSDVLADPDYTYGDVQKVGGYLAGLGVPLLQAGLVIGVIFVNKVVPQPFSAKQIELVTTFADQAVIAIENVRLFDEVQAKTRELEQSLDDLRATQDRLVQTEKLASLGQLTAGIAHEIKNPLNFVNNFSGMSAELIGELQDVVSGLAIDPEAHADIKELTDMLNANLGKIVQHGRRADAIVKSMLLHSGQSSGEHGLSDINALVDECLNRAYYGERAETRGFTIKLEKSFDPTVGEVDLFPREISRAILNLISNGFYATIKRKEAEGSDYEPVLLVATRNRGDRVEIRVRDNGFGIPAEVKEKMFDPFFTTKPAGEGTGLGLSITHDIIVKQHGGSIEVYTKPGEFAEIRLTLARTGALLPERQ